MEAEKEELNTLNLKFKSYCIKEDSYKHRYEKLIEEQVAINKKLSFTLKEKYEIFLATFQKNSHYKSKVETYVTEFEEIKNNNAELKRRIAVLEADVVYYKEKLEELDIAQFATKRKTERIKVLEAEYKANSAYEQLEFAKQEITELLTLSEYEASTRSETDTAFELMQRLYEDILKEKDIKIARLEKEKHTVKIDKVTTAVKDIHEQLQISKETITRMEAREISLQEEIEEYRRLLETLLKREESHRKPKEDPGPEKGNGISFKKLKNDAEGIRLFNGTKDNYNLLNHTIVRTVDGKETVRYQINTDKWLHPNASFTFWAKKDGLVIAPETGIIMTYLTCGVGKSMETKLLDADDEVIITKKFSHTTSVTD